MSLRELLDGWPKEWAAGERRRHRRPEARANPSTNYECGLLGEGLRRARRCIMMTYNPVWYRASSSESGRLRQGQGPPVRTFLAGAGPTALERLQRLGRADSEPAMPGARRPEAPMLMRSVRSTRSRTRPGALQRRVGRRTGGFVPVSEGEFAALAGETPEGSAVDPDLVRLRVRRRAAGGVLSRACPTGTRCIQASSAARCWRHPAHRRSATCFFTKQHPTWPGLPADHSSGCAQELPQARDRGACSSPTGLECRR
jgi:hypothetical protein